MIPLISFYDEYIDRRKFTEQKKNPFEYIVPPPHMMGSEQKSHQFRCTYQLTFSIKLLIIECNYLKLQLRKDFRSCKIKKVTRKVKKRSSKNFAYKKDTHVYNNCFSSNAIDK